MHLAGKQHDFHASWDCEVALHGALMYSGLSVIFGEKLATRTAARWAGAVHDPEWSEVPCFEALDPPLGRLGLLTLGRR